MRDPFADSYGQTASPFRDVPNQSRQLRDPNQQLPIQGPTTSDAGHPNYPADPSMQAWRTGGFNKPSYTAPQFNQYAMAGWDQNKWMDQNHQSPKYVVGRILSNSTPSPEHLAASMAQIQQAYPGATFNGKDRLTLPGVGSFDVGRAFSTNDPNQMQWQWNPLDNGQATSATGQINPLLTAIRGNNNSQNAPNPNEQLIYQLLYGQQ